MFSEVMFLNLIVLVVSWYPYEHGFIVPGEHRYRGVHDGSKHAKSYLNEWTVEVDGGEEVAQLVALELGYVYGGLVRETVLTFRFRQHTNNI